MQEFSFYSIDSLDKACFTIAQTGGKPIAGGTDIIPQMQHDRFHAKVLIDISQLDELRYIEETDDSIHIGALTTCTDILESNLLKTEAPSLVDAASSIGSVQIRNRATLGGNIVNASPAGDTLTPLLTLNALVTLVSVRGERNIALDELLLGPGETDISPDELIHHVSFSRLPSNAKTVFLKVGNRRAMTCAVASAAVMLVLDQDGCVDQSHIALGAVAPRAIRCPITEELLKGKLLTTNLTNQAAFMASSECSPIDDVRATASYRRRLVTKLINRGLRIAGGKET